MLAWDTETCLIEPAQQAPKLVVVSYASPEIGAGLIHQKDALEFAEALLLSTEPMVGHNIAYDLAVLCAKWPHLLPLVFDAYEDERVHDTMLRQKLIDIADGCYRGRFGSGGKWIKFGYSLDDLARRLLKRKLDKDTWRLRYGELIDTPLEEWPEGAKGYARDDAITTYDVYDQQEKYVQKAWPGTNLLMDQYRQSCHAWWLCLTKTWGIRTNPDRVQGLEAQTDEAIRTLVQELVASGLMSFQRKQGVMTPKRNVKKSRERMMLAMGGKERCRLTDKGNIKLDDESCRETGDPVLVAYADYSSLQTVKSKDLPALAKGKWLPIHTNFDSLLATGRTSSSKPNIQNIRRLPGIRECFVPREGKVFASADYDGLELRTMAQACVTLLGWSRLADALNTGKDPHLMMAAQILKISYEEAEARKDEDEVDDARQLSKPGNFGFPGGMGAAAFVEYARGYKNSKGEHIELTLEQALELKENWLATWPEMREYFRIAGTRCDNAEGLAEVEQLFVGRIRGACYYTVACNTLFQGLGADATKAAGWLIAKACYVDQNSVLFGCRMVNYIHDEFILEVPEDKGHECAMELSRLMVEGAAPFLPDVPPTAKKPLLARYWSKKSKPVKNKEGHLIPWPAEHTN
jgi:hypothetical protein